jgi:hypothetical protein
MKEVTISVALATVLAGATVAGLEPTDRSAQPPFNVQAVLRAPDGGDAFGLVEFRQHNDGLVRIDLEAWVRDLEAWAPYHLQRAVDTVLDGSCTSEGWLTLGDGLVPKPLTTDDRGRGRETFYRDLPTAFVGQKYDIHFRVVTATTPPIEVLRSGCHQYVVQPD